MGYGDIRVHPLDRHQRDHRRPHRREKGDITLCLLLSLLFGPFGWIIGLLLPDHYRRICPFCAERIKLAAIVCPHCQRDLPAKPASKSHLPAPPAALDPDRPERSAPYKSEWKSKSATSPSPFQNGATAAIGSVSKKVVDQSVAPTKNWRKPKPRPASLPPASPITNRSSRVSPLATAKLPHAAQIVRPFGVSVVGALADWAGDKKEQAAAPRRQLFPASLHNSSFPKRITN